MKKLTAIIPSLLKNKKYLTDLISVLCLDSSVEKVIVINNSTENFESINPKVEVLSSEQNLFVNPSWNLGVKHATTEYIAIVNDDIKIPYNFCSKILGKINDDIGIAGMRTDNVINTRNKNGEIIIDAEKVALGFSQDIELVPIFKRPDCFGVFMIFKKSYYSEIPEDLKIFWGDDWLIQQAERQGKTNVAICNQNIYHLGSLSSRSFDNLLFQEKKTYSKFYKKSLTIPQRIASRYYKFKTNEFINIFGIKLYRKNKISINNLLNTDTKKIPIYIISFNRLSYLKKLVEKLEDCGYKNIHIIDNNSTYPPLLEYLKTLGHKVHYLTKNYGHDAFWKCGVFDTIKNTNYYAITDCDIMPIEECPDDFMELFFKILIKNLKFSKVGFSLKIDDIPDNNNQKDFIINWESKFFNFAYNCNYKNKNIKIYDADIDTTFALYKPQINRFYKAIRTGVPYQAKHLPWYKNSSAPLNEEDKYYAENVKKGVSNYSVNLTSKELSDKFILPNTNKTLRQKIISMKKYSQYYEIQLFGHPFQVRRNWVNTNLS